MKRRNILMKKQECFPTAAVAAFGYHYGGGGLPPGTSASRGVCLQGVYLQGDLPGGFCLQEGSLRPGGSASGGEGVSASRGLGRMSESCF